MAVKLPGLKSQLWLQAGDLRQQWRALERKVHEHPFNHAIEVISAGSLQVPGSLEGGRPFSFYTSKLLSLAHFISPALIDRYFANGSFAALSANRRIDVDNVFAVLPSGVLLMALNKDTYEQLGLQGKPSRFQKQRFLVEVDLTAAHFKPDKPNYRRVEQCLSDHMELMQADFIMTWGGKDEAQFLADFRAEKSDCVPEMELLQNFPLPKVKGDSPSGLCDGGEPTLCDAQSLYTWLGTVANGINECYSEGAPGSYVSSFVPPDPHSLCEHGVRKRLTGMIASHDICATLEKMRDELSSLPGDHCWMALSVWGFEDAPVTWKTNEHSSYLSADNSYSVVLFRIGQYWLFTSLGDCDTAP